MPVYRPIYFPTPIERQRLNQMRDVAKASRKLLEQPPPIGRKTHQPFLPEEDVESEERLVSAPKTTAG
jgi:hypothetical protein